MPKADKLHTNETQDTSYRHVLKYTGIFGSVQGLKLLVSIARNKITTELLGAPALGLISVYSSMSEFIASCTNFGLPLNATRESSELFEDGTPTRITHFVCVVRTWALWTSALAVLLCLLLSPLLSWCFFDEDFSRWPEIVMLIPIVVSLIVGEAECSLLKGFRQLRRVAKIETIVAFTTLLTTIPFYYIWGMKGIIMGLVTSFAVSCFVHLYYSIALFPYRVKPLSSRIFTEGWPMIRRGIPYVLAGIVNSGVAMLIPMLILKVAAMDEVGYYRAGYSLMVAYSGIIFVALEADYYPRLSAVNHDRARLNRCVNQQIDVSLRLITPFLILFIFCMPWILPLFYRGDFIVVLGMTTCAAGYMFFRSIMLPVSYTSLARGDSLLFLFLEVVSALAIPPLIWYFYGLYGLSGAGLALSLSSLFDLVMSLIICRWRYGVRLSRVTWLNALLFFITLSLAVFACLRMEGTWRYVIAAITFLISATWSLRGLIRQTKKT